MPQQEIELQISVNIRDQRYLISVPKNADISKLVSTFLLKNQLNPRYQAAILRLVNEKLVQQQPANQIRQFSPKSKPEESLNYHTSSPTKIQPHDQRQAKIPDLTVNNKIKMGLISKIKQQLQSNHQPPSANQPDGKKVYEQWKLKQKQKTKREPKHQKSCQNSRISNNKTAHSPDYLYKKGLKFKQDSEQNCEAKFKKLYPFKINPLQLSQPQQQQLFSRLSKERRQIPVKEYLSRKAQDENSSYIPRNDPIKRKLRQQDQQVDRALFEMIKQGEYPSNCCRTQSRSPFRKTVLR